MNKITRIIIFIAVGIALSVSCVLGYEVSSLNRQVEFLQIRNNMLVVDYATSEQDIEDLKATITGLNQELESNYLTMSTNKLYISDLEYRVLDAEYEYQSAISYIETAEIIMNKIDVQYLYGGRR